MNSMQPSINVIDENTVGVIFSTPEGDLELQVVTGIDGVPVVYLDTPAWEDGPYGPRMRVWVNDETVYEGVAVPGPDSLEL